MSKEQSSYRGIMKATSIFGGVQVFNIIIQIVRSKYIAVLLGPSGMGLMGLLTSTIGIIESITNFGLGTSAVKDIASANNNGDSEQISKTITVFRKLVWITGTFGAILTFILSPWLSRFTFGNKNFTTAFMWVSITLLFSQLSSGQLVILQGMRKLKYLAKANLLGSFFALFVTFPLYYLMGIDGIVPGIIGSACITLILANIYSRKVKIKNINVTPLQILSQGKSMLQMGFLISLSGLLTGITSYIIRIFINHTGGVDQVGLYNAGFAIINTYVGLVFTAMGTDYYPRLSAVAHDNKLCIKNINQQAEIAILILAPILIVFLIFINWVVILLYSKQFTEVNGMIYWASVGMLFKAASWAIAFLFLAKGSGMLFFWNEFIANIYLLGFNLLGYHLWGLTGLGISFLGVYIFYLAQVYWVSKIKYAFSFQNNFINIFSIQFSLVFTSFIVIIIFDQPYTYLFGIIIIIISLWYSIYQLNKLIGLVFIIEYFKKFKTRL